MAIAGWTWTLVMTWNWAAVSAPRWPMRMVAPRHTSTALHLVRLRPRARRPTMKAKITLRSVLQ